MWVILCLLFVSVIILYSFFIFFLVLFIVIDKFVIFNIGILLKLLLIVIVFLIGILKWVVICCILFFLCLFLFIIFKLVGVDVVIIILVFFCNIFNSCVWCVVLNVKMKNLDIFSFWLFIIFFIFLKLVIRFDFFCFFVICLSFFNVILSVCLFFLNVCIIWFCYVYGE